MQDCDMIALEYGIFKKGTGVYLNQLNFVWSSINTF
jgi:hypothetical protein